MFDRESTPCVVCGDTNIDLAKTLYTRPYVQAVSSCSFRNLITAPTRTCDLTATHIDHIFTNKLTSALTAGTLTCDVSDHDATYVVFHENIYFANTVQYETNWTKYKPKRYLENLTRELNKTWKTHEGGTELSIDSMLSIISEAIRSQSAREFRVEKITKIKKKSWLTQSLLRCILKQHCMYREIKKNPLNRDLIDRHKKYKNALCKLLRTNKKSYHEHQLQQLKNKPKQAWQPLNHTLGRTKMNKTQPSTIMVDGKLTSSPQAKASGFNKFFSSVGKNLAEKIPSVPNDPSPLVNIPQNKLVSMFLNLPTLGEIITEIRRLNPNKQGNDQLQTRLIRDAAPAIAPFLLHVCKVSFRKGIFPDSMKSARVTPLYKTDNPTDPANYRPISVLPTFSKIFERLYHTRLAHFFESNNLLYKRQYGFRKNRSTAIALTNFYETLTRKTRQRQPGAGNLHRLEKSV
eukprot:Lithocolla_globosa_v1_NODE_1526_length_2513_cov_5.229361.p1 type:complete len:461 gc:universal NODE_1526_length_2513_cov_5.229361:2154-772(-)